MLFLDPFLKNRNIAYLWINSLKFYTACFIVCQVEGYQNNIETRKATGFKFLRLNTGRLIRQHQNKIDFWTKLSKKVSNRKSEHHYKILHIQISLGTKFRLNLTLSNFWIKLTQEGYFRTNNKKKKITIDFYIFKLI